ncbi:hypothetical protein Ahy_A03g011895 [Arachis hypogaea]|uniref:Uncharacterized protein n=1 Tax=Arachis hypogaea TaxID=3818 RepID=A0A445DS21_ARAHY|nr:hypothetical protein Ahy_A03g011895 [Arachis hypogaea]
MSNTSTASSTSSDETRGNESKNSSVSSNAEPTLLSVKHDSVGHAHLELNATHINTMGWPPYGLPPGYVPSMVTQGLPVSLYSTFQNFLYQNAYGILDVPIFGVSGSYISQQNFVHAINTGNNSASNSTTLTVTRVENSRPVFPDMSRAIPVNQLSQTIRSLVNIRQQMDKSYHDLVNMLTHQMVTILNPFLANTNTRTE